MGLEEHDIAHTPLEDFICNGNRQEAEIKYDWRMPQRYLTKFLNSDCVACFARFQLFERKRLSLIEQAVQIRNRFAIVSCSLNLAVSVKMAL